MIQDLYARPLRNLRVSVTDRCNLRCAYCMPEQDYVWLPREDVLQFEEIEALIDVFLAEGVDKAMTRYNRRSGQPPAAAEPPS